LDACREDCSGIAAKIDYDGQCDPVGERYKRVRKEYMEDKNVLIQRGAPGAGHARRAFPTSGAVMGFAPH
jgi:hypothetical protein